MEKVEVKLCGFSGSVLRDSPGWLKHELQPQGDAARTEDGKWLQSLPEARGSPRSSQHSEQAEILKPGHCWKQELSFLWVARPCSVPCLKTDHWERQQPLKQPLWQKRKHQPEAFFLRNVREACVICVYTHVKTLLQEEDSSGQRRSRT